MKKEYFSGLQLVCNSRFIDKKRTTAHLTVGRPEKREKVLTFDKPWEGNHSCYRSIIKEDGFFRLYYLAWYIFKDAKEIKVCYAESKDGVNWVKPVFGIKEYLALKENNIILDSDDVPGYSIDNFFAFKDSNPACPKEQRYKALVNSESNLLRYYYSEDGVSFTDGGDLTVEGVFDSLNVCFYDEKLKSYVMYLRAVHDSPYDEKDKYYRDIRRSQSTDFKTWTTPVRLNYIDNPYDFQLYTNNVMRYPGNPDLLVGFPTRYCMRPEWTDNYEKLPGKAERLERIKINPRLGLAVTDCLFMVSENGYDFDLFNEAFLTPGPETDKNWVYGDCYPAYGLFEENAGEYRFYVCQNHHMQAPSEMYKFTIRKDGFAYYRAPFEEKLLVLNKKYYKGGKIYINFATSAMGYVKVVIEDMKNKVESCEMFGDNVRREISIPQEELEKFKGKKIRITIKMKDANVYSLIFA